MAHKQFLATAAPSRFLAALIPLGRNILFLPTVLCQLAASHQLETWSQRRISASNKKLRMESQRLMTKRDWLQRIASRMQRPSNGFNLPRSSGEKRLSCILRNRKRPAKINCPFGPWARSALDYASIAACSNLAGVRDMPILPAGDCVANQWPSRRGTSVLLLKARLCELAVKSAIRSRSRNHTGCSLARLQRYTVQLAWTDRPNSSWTFSKIDTLRGSAEVSKTLLQFRDSSVA